MTALLDLSALSASTLNTMWTRESSMADTISRMSSGLRLTNAGDDIAAHMMSVRLDNRSRGWTEASRNVQNGLSLLETADGAMAGIQDALGRMRELAIEAANGTLTASDRAMIEPELETLRSFIYDTIESTEFNGLKPLAGNSSFSPPAFDLSGLVPTAGANPSAGAATQTGTYAVNITQAARRGELLGGNQALTIAPGNSPTTLTITTQLGTVNVVITDGDPPASWPGLINPAAAAVGVQALLTDNTTMLEDGTQADPFNDKYLMFRTTGQGSDQTLSVTTDQVGDGTGFGTPGGSTTGVDMQGTIEGTPFTASGLTITAAAGSNGADGLSFTFAGQPPVGAAGTIQVTVPAATVSDFTHIVQMAPDHMDEHTISIDSLTTGVMATTGANTLGTLTFATQVDASDAIATIDALIEHVSGARSDVGAHMSALDIELRNAIDGALTTTAAESRITDADMAVEASALMQEQLAQQVQSSVLQAIHAQSNSSLELMVSMLSASPLQAAA